MNNIPLTSLSEKLTKKEEKTKLRLSRDVIRKSGTLFMYGPDQENYKNASMLQKAGLLSMVSVIPLGLFFSKKISQNRIKGSTFIFQNLFLTAGLCVLYGNSQWRFGKM